MGITVSKVASAEVAAARQKLMQHNQNMDQQQQQQQQQQQPRPRLNGVSETENMVVLGKSRLQASQVEADARQMAMHASSDDRIQPMKRIGKPRQFNG